MNNQKIAVKLRVANHDFGCHHRETALIAAELILANKALKFQNIEKEKRAAELVLANKELKFQNKEKEKRANELAVANKELAFQNKEKEHRSLELTKMNDELRKAELYQKEYTKGLEEIIHIISHKVRHPICQILGISNLMFKTTSKDEINTMNSFINESACSLDTLTKDLSKLIGKLKHKGIKTKNTTAKG